MSVRKSAAGSGPEASAAAVRRAMFGPERAPADLLGASESGGDEDVSLYRVRYTGLARPSGISDRHLVLVNVGLPFRAECRIGTERLAHCAMTGNITVIPAETEWNAVLPTGAEGIIAALPKARLDVAMARTVGAAEAIRPKLRGEDPPLASILREMAQDARWQSPGSSAWHRLADELADHLSVSYAARGACRCRGRLAPETIARINDFLENRLDEPLAIDIVADVARQSRSHFPRLFRRTIGMSPHQYVMRLRLRRARTLIQRGWPLAEVAAAAGFSDQSHLTNWVRRIYGTTPGRLSAHR